MYTLHNFFFTIREFSIREKYYTFMYSSFQYNPNSFVYMYIYANIITISRFNFYIKQKNYLYIQKRVISKHELYKFDRKLNRKFEQYCRLTGFSETCSEK